MVEWSRRGGFAAYVTQIALYWRLETYELTGLEARGDWVIASIHIVATNWASKGRFDTVVTGRMRFSDGLVVEYHEDVDVGALKAAARR